MPDGQWNPCEEWWHIPVLYDLRDSGFEPLRTSDAKQALDSGEEGVIRDFAAELGFVRVSRHMIDGKTFSQEQLASLKELLELCSPDEEIEILGPNPAGPVRRMTVERILKLQNASLIFPKEDRS
jgi:hypothetical protein